MKSHGYQDGHSGVPMGCTCGYHEVAKMKAAEPECPDYVNDANTRPEMLALLESRDLTRHIVNNVCVLSARPEEIENDFSGWTDKHLWMCLSVPQPLFAEAFLQTLNLWEP